MSNLWLALPAILWVAIAVHLILRIARRGHPDALPPQRRRRARRRAAQYAVDPNEAARLSGSWG